MELQNLVAANLANHPRKRQNTDQAETAYYRSHDIRISSRLRPIASIAKGAGMALVAMLAVHD